MIIIVGLVILVAAVVAGVAGVLANSGHAHALPHGFAVFGYHVTGSTGTLFLYGIVIGALGMLGLSLLLAGARRTSRRGREARRGLRQSRREAAAASSDRDDLIGQRDTARAYTASTLGTGNGNGSPRADRDPGPPGPRPGRLRLFARRPARRPETLPGQAANAPAANAPASASAPAE
jgi:hypothetical protein